MVESGYPDKLLTLNGKGEFSYLILTQPERPRLEVISPGFPGVGGEVGSDAENHVAWLVRGRGVYMIDLESGKTGHMVTGNWGRVLQVLLADPERRLFTANVFSAEASMFFTYDMKKGEYLGETGVLGVSTINSLGNGKILIEQFAGVGSKGNGYYIEDTFLSEMKSLPKPVYPGGEPLSKALTENRLQTLNEMQKHLHQGKRILFAQFKQDVPVFNCIIQWNDSMDKIEIRPLPQLDTTMGTISADGNWITGIAYPPGIGTEIIELVVNHIQPFYPQGVSTSVSLGYTNKDPGAFMTHSTLGTCYVEQSSVREGILFIYKMSDAEEILKRRAMKALGK